MMGLEEIDNIAREYWQNEFAKFYTIPPDKRSEPSYVEYSMFSAGFKAALQQNSIVEYARLIKAIKDNPQYVGEEWEIKETAFLNAVLDEEQKND